MTSRRPINDRGQAAIALVVLLSIIISVFGGILAENAVQHDPIVQTDVVEHFAYRALESGMNTFLSKVNDNPNEMACNVKAASGGQCQAGLYMNWKQVVGNTGTEAVPEYYAWGTPRFCYTESCPVSTPEKGATPPRPVLYVKVTIYGAAGAGSRIFYQQSTLNLKPVNGFLTRIWWSTYEATDPHLITHPTTTCTYDYADLPNHPAYTGPNNVSSNVCSPVVFATNTQVYGPIYSNDSIYYQGRPKLGPVETHDPTCLFVRVNGTTPQGAGHTISKSSDCVSIASQATKSRAQRAVTQTTATFQMDTQGATHETLPNTDATLEKYAALDGCVYTGPTTIEFDATDSMTVWSQDTPAVTPTATHPECPSTNVVTPVTKKDKPADAAQHTAPAPNGVNGNGVIWVQTKTTVTSCVAGANPFDDYTTTTHKNGVHAQYGSTGSKTKFDYYGQGSYPPDCEGDAFVSDNPTTGGIQGQLTVASTNDVVITGTIKYTDCGTTFDSTVNHPCAINTTGRVTNDSLGLIALNYVLVNHPVTTACRTVREYHRGAGYVTVSTCNETAASLAPACSSLSGTVLGTPAAALCNPITASSGSTITIDAAVLALQHSFAVDNEGYTNKPTGVGGADGTLKVYGSIDQMWRGTVGIVNGYGDTVSGFTKDYDWNAEGAVITPPHYLAPATASWAIGSSAITVDTVLAGPPDGLPVP